MSVPRVVNHGEKFDDCNCANKWEWLSVEVEAKVFSREEGMHRHAVS